MPDGAEQAETAVIRTFIFGIPLGIAAVIATLHYVPIVDQAREVSIISVLPNGGNTETFHVKIPMDRIMNGAPGQSNPLPPGLVWPDYPEFGDVRAELFKVRNSRDAVIGVASRLATTDPQLGSIIEWALHFPARGSMLISMRPQPENAGRVGDLTAGTREFSKLRGRLSERWVAAPGGADGAPSGHIELMLRFVSSEYELPDEQEAAQ